MKINKFISEKIGVALFVLGVVTGSAALLLPTANSSRDGSIERGEIDLPEKVLEEESAKDLQAFSVFFLTSSGLLLTLAGMPNREEAISSGNSNKEIKISIVNDSESRVVNFSAQECTDASIKHFLDRFGQDSAPNSALESQESENPQKAPQHPEQSIVENETESNFEKETEMSNEPRAISAGSSPINIPQKVLDPLEPENLPND